jgi:hypothetical protein
MDRSQPEPNPSPMCLSPSNGKATTMNATSPIQTQPEPEHLAHAGDLLEAVLLGDLDLNARLAVGAALTTLYDVFPPYDPRPAVTEPLDLRTGTRLALDSLTTAIEAADSVQVAIRAGLAARELRALQDRQ